MYEAYTCSGISTGLVAGRGFWEIKSVYLSSTQKKGRLKEVCDGSHKAVRRRFKRSKDQKIKSGDKGEAEDGDGDEEDYEESQESLLGHMLVSENLIRQMNTQLT